MKLRHRGELHAISAFDDSSLKSVHRAADTEVFDAKMRNDLKEARRRKALAKAYNLMWLAGPVIGLGCTVLSMATFGGFSLLHDPISLILKSRNQPILSGGLIATGLMTAVSARHNGSDQSSKDSKLMAIGKTTLTLSGIALAGVGLSFGPMQFIHNASAATYFASAPVAMGLFGASMIAQEEQRSLGMLSIAAAVAAATVISISYVTLGKAVSAFELAQSAIIGAWGFTIGARNLLSERSKKKAAIAAMRNAPNGSA